MLNVKHKRDWFEVIDQLTPTQRENTMVNCFLKPHGIFFEVRTEHGVSVLEHNNTIYVGDPISSALTKAGYEGKVIVSANMANHQMPRWLSYQLINHKGMTKRQLSSWLNKITVYTFKPIEKPCSLAIQTIYPLSLAVGDIFLTNRARSSSDDYDGMCFEHEEEFYHILPSRITIGEVRSVMGDSLIVLVDLPEGVRPIRARYLSDESATDDLIGKTVTVKFTERLKGCCINNLMSATVINYSKEAA